MATSKWRADGTSDSPKPIDIRLPELGRLQITSGVTTKPAYEMRVNAITEAWTLGGVRADAVRALHAKRFTLDAFMQARQKGDTGIVELLSRTSADPLADIVRDYLKELKAQVEVEKPVWTTRNVSPVTRAQQKYDRLLAWFTKELGRAPTTADLTSAAVETFLSSLVNLRNKYEKNRGVSGGTTNRYRAAVGSLATWAVKHKRMDAHPVKGKQVVKRAEAHHRLPEMSANEYRDYMAYVRDNRPELAVVLLLLIHTGADISEVFSRLTMDVSFETNKVRYFRSKIARFDSAKPRFVPMPAMVVAEVRAHIAEHGRKGSMPLFDGVFGRSEIEGIHRRAAGAIARPELTIKDLRHIAAIAWVKSGVHIRTVMKWLGHTSLSQTMKYTDFEPDDAVATAMAENAAQTLDQAADVTPITPIRKKKVEDI